MHTTSSSEPDAADAEARPGWKRNVALLLIGQSVSMFGTMLVMYAIMWHLTLTTQSGVVMTLSLIAGTVPSAIMSIFGGVWADRHNRRVLINVADAGVAAATAVLALVMLGGYQELWLILMVQIVRSIGQGIQQPAVAALLPQVVPTERLGTINGVWQTISAATMLIGPAVAAAIYGSWSIVPILFIDVVTAVIGIGLIFLIKVPTLRTAETRGGYFDDLRAGLRYTFGHRFVRWLLLLLAGLMMLTAGPSFLTPLLVVRSYGHVGPEVWLLTANEVAWGLGMLAGGGLFAALAPKLTRKVLVVVVVCLAFGLLIAGMGLVTNFWAYLALMLIAGMSLPPLQASMATLLQERVEPEYHGRVFGLLGVLMSLSMPIGMAFLGPLADVVSVESVLVGCGLAALVIVAIGVLVPDGRAALASDRPRPEPEPVSDSTAG